MREMHFLEIILSEARGAGKIPGMVGSSGCREYLQLLMEESWITGPWLSLLIKEHPGGMEICVL